MHIYCVDDTSSHLLRIIRSVRAACEAKGIKDFTIVECSDGQELLDKIGNNEPVLVTLDINMPIVDGLTALVKLRSQKQKCNIIMISSENIDVIKRLATKGRYGADDKKQKKLLMNVVDRVKSGQEEEGKINSILEACANLGMDPLEVAKMCGATDIIQKPYEIEDASKKIQRYM